MGSTCKAPGCPRVDRGEGEKEADARRPPGHILTMDGRFQRLAIPAQSCFASAGKGIVDHGSFGSLRRCCSPPGGDACELALFTELPPTPARPGRVEFRSPNRAWLSREGGGTSIRFISSKYFFFARYYQNTPPPPPLLNSAQKTVVTRRRDRVKKKGPRVPCPDGPCTDAANSSWPPPVLVAFVALARLQL